MVEARLRHRLAGAASGAWRQLARAWRQLADAPEAVAGRSVARPLPRAAKGVLSGRSRRAGAATCLSVLRCCDRLDGRLDRGVAVPARQLVHLGDDVEVHVAHDLHRRLRAEGQQPSDGRQQPRRARDPHAQELELQVGQGGQSATGYLPHQARNAFEILKTHTLTEHLSKHTPVTHRVLGGHQPRRPTATASLSGILRHTPPSAQRRSDTPLLPMTHAVVRRGAQLFSSRVSQSGR